MTTGTDSMVAFSADLPPDQVRIEPADHTPLERDHRQRQRFGRQAAPAALEVPLET